MKILALLLLFAGTVMAQTAGQTTTTTQPDGSTTTSTTVAATPPHNEAAGTIVSYDATALRLVVATPNSTAPVSYVVNSSTAFVDDANKPIPGSLLISGSPVTVYFEPTGDPPLAQKVILRKIIKPGG